MQALLTPDKIIRRLLIVKRVQSVFSVNVLFTYHIISETMCKDGFGGSRWKLSFQSDGMV